MARIREVSSVSRRGVTPLGRGFLEASSERDLRFFHDNLADDALLVLPIPTMPVLTKSLCIQAMSAGSDAWTSYQIVEPRFVHIVAELCVSLSYKAAARRADGSAYKAGISSVYVNRSGVWKMALHQQTPLVETN